MSALHAQISSLPPDERLNLIDEIWESLSVAPETLPVPDEVLDELARRRERYCSDPDSLQDWEEFRAGHQIRRSEAD